MTKIQRTSAYQGKGWRPRKTREQSGTWSDFRVNSEYAQLRAVLLYKPSRKEVQAIRRPAAVQQLRAIHFPTLEREYLALKNAYRRNDVQVFEIDPALLVPELRRVPPNAMFVRDLFFNTPSGCVLARMASEVRAGEEKFAAAKLTALGMPLLLSAHGRAVFEGADCLWLNPKLALCGVGSRTNRPAFRQISALLKAQGVRLIEVKMPKGVQHLLGLLQLVDKNLAVVRTEIAPAALLALLRRQNITVIPVNEGDEVRMKLGMNFVTLSRRRILMADDCPNLRRTFTNGGLSIAAEVPITQLRHAAGGIGCATGILARRLIP